MTDGKLANEKLVVNNKNELNNRNKLNNKNEPNDKNKLNNNKNKLNNNKNKLNNNKLNNIMVFVEFWRIWHPIDQAYLRTFMLTLMALNIARSKGW